MLRKPWEVSHRIIFICFPKTYFSATFNISSYCTHYFFERVGSKRWSPSVQMERRRKRARNLKDLFFIQNDSILCRKLVYNWHKRGNMLIPIFSIFESHSFKLYLKVCRCMRRWRKIDSSEFFLKLWSSICHIVHNIVRFSYCCTSKTKHNCWLRSNIVQLSFFVRCEVIFVEALWKHFWVGSSCKKKSSNSPSLLNEICWARKFFNFQIRCIRCHCWESKCFSIFQLFAVLLWNNSFSFVFFIRSALYSVALETRAFILLSSPLRRFSNSPDIVPFDTELSPAPLRVGSTF